MSKVDYKNINWKGAKVIAGGATEGKDGKYYSIIVVDSSCYKGLNGYATSKEASVAATKIIKAHLDKAGVLNQFDQTDVGGVAMNPSEAIEFLKSGKREPTWH